MAKEAWTVFYKPEDAGAQPCANWKEKDIVVKEKEKNSGLFATLQTVSIKGAQGTEIQPTFNNSKALEKSPLISNSPISFLAVTIEAEGAEEAALAVARYYGADTVQGKVLAAATTNLTETVAQ